MCRAREHHVLFETPIRAHRDRNPHRNCKAEAKTMMRPDHYILVQITLMAGAAAAVGEMALRVARHYFGG